MGGALVFITAFRHLLIQQTVVMCFSLSFKCSVENKAEDRTKMMTDEWTCQRLK